MRPSVLAAAALILVIQPLAAQTRIRDMTYTHAVDPITGEDRSTLAAHDLSGSQLHDAALLWRCNGSDPEVIVAADEFLSYDTPVRVRWRFDSDAPSATGQHWTVSTDGTGVFLPQSMVEWFTQQARAANKVVVRVSDFRGVDYTLKFSLRGLTAGLKRMKCAPFPMSLHGGLYFPRPPLGPKVIVIGSAMHVDAAAELAIWCQDGRFGGAFQTLGVQEFLTGPRLIADGRDVLPNPLGTRVLLSGEDARRIAHGLAGATGAEVQAFLPDASQVRIPLPVAVLDSIPKLPCWR